MHCVVTGGAGFIGSHLVELLLAAGHRVTVIDNLSTGRLANLDPVNGHRGLDIRILDITGSGALEGAFNGVDWVFHLAALADIVPSIQRPLEYHRANVDGTAAVLEAARAAGVRRLIYAASSSCYGIPDVYPTPETAPIQPRYPYALTKAVGEQYVRHWAEVYGLSAVCLRLFNVYGPRSRTSGSYGAVFGVFLAQLLAGQPLTVVGDGEQTRDFTFVTDVAAAFVNAAASDRNSEGGAAVYNVGTGQPVSVNRLVELLGAPPTLSIPKRPGEPDCTHADITRIRRDLGWQPAVSIEDGVPQLLARIEDWRTAPVWTVDAINQTTLDWFKYLRS